MELPQNGQVVASAGMTFPHLSQIRGTQHPGNDAENRTGENPGDDAQGQDHPAAMGDQVRPVGSRSDGLGHLEVRERVGQRRSRPGFENAVALVGRSPGSIVTAAQLAVRCNPAFQQPPVQFGLGDRAVNLALRCLHGPPLDWNNSGLSRRLDRAARHDKHGAAGRTASLAADMFIPDTQRLAARRAFRFDGHGSSLP